jgi:hypothetical protein
MADIQWNEMIAAEILAKPNGLWTRAYDYVSGPKKLSLEVKPKADGTLQTWKYSTLRECSANGDLGSSIGADRCLLKTAPVGALIGKIGGSTAGATDGTITFIVGQFCVVEFDEKVKGPLFLTINDEPSGFADNDGQLSVTLSEAPW